MDEIEKKNFEITITETNKNSDKENIEIRKKKLIDFLKKYQLWVWIILIVALVLGIYIRSLPMLDHGGRPGLWDITTNTWTLGPDLDPWLFLRTAKTIVEKGSVPKIDEMRYVPLGFDVTQESLLLPYLIVLTYKGLGIIGKGNIEFAGVVLPVIMFALTIIAFFLFVREIFIRKDSLNANMIALISTFFMIVIPVFLPRTIAGIPEKESSAFFFMFLAFYFFLKAWKSDTENSSNYLSLDSRGTWRGFRNFLSQKFQIKNIEIFDKWKAIIFSILSGVATALMGLLWGGVIYAFITIASASLLAFILNKIRKKEVLIYSLWLLASFFIMINFSHKYSLIGLLSSLNTGLAFLVFFIFLVDFVLWNKWFKIFNENKIPRNIISLITAFVLLVVLSMVFFGPYFIVEKIKAIHQIIFKPIFGRWNITVAENRQPDFKEWSASFGPFIKNLPIFFWMFFIGSVMLFKKMTNEIRKKDSLILTGGYIILFFGMVFSRYSSASIFNGENFISKTFYYASVLLMIGILFYYQLDYFKRKDKSFEKIDYEFLFLFLLFILTLFTARGAVRLIMVLGPISSIFVGFLIVESINKFRETKDDTKKIILGLFVILILAASIFSFWVFYQETKVQSYNFVPSYYNIQWQKAMKWVRDETPKNSVFGHWWDYGYWVQSIGERATVLDGGNAYAYWNYLMGRYVLTGDNQKDALEFLYNHNTTHFLIDSSDIGKYTAFSSIGSDIDYDRYSWFGTFILDNRQTQETRNQTLYVYSGGIGLDEDLIINESGRNILLPKQAAGVGAIILPTTKEGAQQPYIIVVYQGQQHKVALRYLHINGKFLDFKSGIEAAAYIFPRLDQQGQGLNQVPIGAAMFISPRLFRGLLSQIYILDDPLERFPNFKLVHTEQNLIIDNLKAQGLALPDFVYFNGIQGPIKIWKVEYTGEEKIKQEYLDIDPRKYLDWEL